MAADPASNVKPYYQPQLHSDVCFDGVRARSHDLTSSSAWDHCCDDAEDEWSQLERICHRAGDVPQRGHPLRSFLTQGSLRLGGSRSRRKKTFSKKCYSFVTSPVFACRGLSISRLSE
jgi:hypothetical protein